MNKMDNIIDEKIKNYASLQTIELPYGYDKMIESKVNQCLKEENKKKFKMPKMAVAVFLLALLSGGASGVYTAKNYIYERLSLVSQEEQKNYVNELFEANANADNYLRHLTKEERKRIKELDVEIDRDEAMSLAKDKIGRVFGIDIKNATISQEYHQGEAGQDAFSELFVYAAVDDLTYSATVDLQTGNIYELSVNSQQSNYASGIMADTDLYMDMSAEAEELAKKYDLNTNFIRCEMEFTTNEQHELYTGIVNYIFTTDDGHVCVVGYSCATKRFYLVRYFTNEAFETYCEQKDKMCEKRGYTRNTFEF